MCSNSETTVNAETQTVIRVFPHVLDQALTAQIASNKKLQTVMSFKPNEDDDRFYSLLRFTPYRDIQEHSMRVIDLPRKIRLQFTPTVEFDKMAETARMFSLADDDGVGYICSDIIHRLENKQKSYYVDACVQTDLKVCPHLLEEENVAEVLTDTSAQTSPRNSDSDIVELDY